MGTGQTLLAIGSLMLISAMVLSVNQSLDDNDTAILEGQIGMVAVSVIQSVIEDYENRKFTDLTIGTTQDTVYGMSSGSTDAVDIPVDIPYTVAVTYVNPTAPEIDVTGPTSYKRIKVTGSSDYLTNDIEMSYIKSSFYWLFIK